MDAVKSFNSELSSLYEVKPPISKAKMTAITRGAIKAIKFYKHVVQSVEKFILKCKPEYKVPGLYVIDSIVRQSRHQFGADKDVFAPRFAKNMRQTFINLFVCPGEDKSKIIRVLNLWQKNQVFAPDVIQPLFDLADPNNPIHKELGTTPLQQPSNGMNANNTGGAASAGAVAIKGSPALQKTPTKGSQQGIDGTHLGGTNLNLTDPSVLVQLQQLQRLLTQNTGSKTEAQVHFDRKLLDFDYGDDDDEANSSPKTNPGETNPVSNLLTNPEVLRQLQTLQQTMTAGQPAELDIDKLRKLQEMKQQEEEFDKHLAQTVPNLPFAAECEFKPGSNSSMLTGSYYLPAGADLSQPPPGYKPQLPFELPPQPALLDNDVQFVEAGGDNGGEDEIITLDHGDSRSPTPQHEERYRRSRRSRSRDRSRDRRDRDRRSRRTRSRSKSRRHRSRSRDRDRNRVKEKETEKDKERKKRGLPSIKKDNLSVCSTTLWVGHLSKLVHQEDLSNTFGEFGDIVSIDLIPPRGCAFIVMHRRQDAARCLAKLKNHILHGKAITLAWAPGKGVKGKDLKDYWEGDLGTSYIPWHKLKPDIDLEMLEDGGMIDEDTMPAWMKAKVSNNSSSKPTTNTQSLSGILQLEVAANNFMQQLSSDMNQQQQQQPKVDTSQPPPVPGSGLLQPPPIPLPLVNPFQLNNLNNRLLVGMNLPPGLLGNVPIGVPPPSLMQNQLVGLGSPFQNPPTSLMPPQQMNENKSSSSESNMQSLSESLMSMTQPFGMMPQPPIGLPAPPHDDNMDIEMEDAEKAIERPPPPLPLPLPLLSEQLQASMGIQFNQNRNSSSNGNEEVDARREERRHRSRERERERDRNRERSRGYEREESRGREMERRDRANRWGEREPLNLIDPLERRDREKTLNDRLQQMAMANEDIYSSLSSSSQRERGSSNSESENLGVMPPSLLDRRMFPPHNNGLQHPPLLNPEEEMYMQRDDFENPILDEYQGGGGGGGGLLEHPDYVQRMEMHPRMHRDDYEERFMRGGGGRRDFRENRGRDYFQRDGFGQQPPPPPPPILRGGPEFAPRPPLMRGGMKFHPRGGGGGPPMRGPRLSPWKERNYGPPRFDHPEYHRGGGGGGPPPGPPGMFDEPPHMRHSRGGRFEERRRGRLDFGGGGHENSMSGGSEVNERTFEKRSRWGDSSSQDEHEPAQIVDLVGENSGSGGEGSCNVVQEIQSLVEEELRGDDGNVVENESKGGNTPLHDEEPLCREMSLEEIGESQMEEEEEEREEREEEERYEVESNVNQEEVPAGEEEEEYGEKIEEEEEEKPREEEEEVNQVKVLPSSE